jgi:putative peptidoglycan lipid II flippase
VDGSAKDSAGADITGRHKRLARRTLLVSGLTLVSRVLGYAREILSAALFGDRSAVYDAFITAWRVPNLFRRFLGEGALSTSFQTALTRVDGDRGEAAGRRLFLDTARLLIGILIALALVVMGAVSLMPDQMPVTGWAWLGADPEPVRVLTVRLMPFVLLACLAALVGGALQVRGRFGPPAWAPAVLNVVWVSALVGLWLNYGAGEAGLVNDGRDLEMAKWLSWGVLLAGLFQLAVQVPALRSAGFLGTAPPTVPEGPGAWSVLRASAPLALGAAAYQINVMLDGLMAEGLLPDGGPTLHYYANRVQQFPMALIAVAATSAVFPALQAFGHKGERRALRDLHDRTHRAIAFVALPASVGLFVLAQPVIAASFERGAFGAEGVTRATAALRMLCLAILPAGATGLVARTYYALGDFKSPVRVSVVMLALNVVLNLVFVRGIGMDVEGLALATALTSWGGLALLLPGLGRRLDLPAGTTAFAGPLGRMALASAGSAAAAWGARELSHGALGRALALVVAIAVGVVTYGLLATLLRVPEVRVVRDRLAARRNKRS